MHTWTYSLAAIRNRHTQTHTTQAHAQHRTRAETEPGTQLMLIHNQMHVQPQTGRPPTETQDTPGHTDRYMQRWTHTHFLPKQMRIEACTGCKCRPACAYPRSTWTPTQLMHLLGIVTNPLVKKLQTALYEASLALKPSTRARLGK